MILTDICPKGVSYNVSCPVTYRPAHLRPCFDMFLQVTADVPHCCCHCQYPNLLLVRDYHLRERERESGKFLLSQILIWKTLFCFNTHKKQHCMILILSRCIFFDFILLFHLQFGATESLCLHFILTDLGKCSVIPVSHYVRNGTVKTERQVPAKQISL